MDLPGAKGQVKVGQQRILVVLPAGPARREFPGRGIDAIKVPVRQPSARQNARRRG